jgi:hypothetical protein
MAHRTIRIVVSALEGVPFHVRSIEPAEERRGLRGFEVALAIEDRSALRSVEASLMGSAVTFLIEEPGGEPSQVCGTVTEVSLLERADVGGASLRLLVRTAQDAEAAPPR